MAPLPPNHNPRGLKASSLSPLLCLVFLLCFFRIAANCFRFKGGEGRREPGDTNLFFIIQGFAFFFFFFLLFLVPFSPLNGWLEMVS